MKNISVLTLCAPLRFGIADKDLGTFSGDNSSGKVSGSLSPCKALNTKCMATVNSYLSRNPSLSTSDKSQICPKMGIANLEPTITCRTWKKIMFFVFETIFENQNIKARNKIKESYFHTYQSTYESL